MTNEQHHEFELYQQWKNEQLQRLQDLAASCGLIYMCDLSLSSSYPSISVNEDSDGYVADSFEIRVSDHNAGHNGLYDYELRYEQNNDLQWAMIMNRIKSMSNC